MSAHDRRRCPGIGGRECGTFMSPLFRDSHPACTRCRGRNCSSTSTCSICDGWSLDQWEHFRNKRSYAGRSKSSSHHSGDPTETASNPPLSPASTRFVSLAPPSLPTPHPSEGLGEGREVMGVVDVKLPRVSSSPSVPKHKQGKRGRDTPLVLAENGDAFATSLTSGRGRSKPHTHTHPAQPDSLAVKSPPLPRPHRPNLPSFQHVDHWREGEIRAPSPAPSSPCSERGREERERGMDRSRASDFHGKSNRHRSSSGDHS